MRKAELSWPRWLQTIFGAIVVFLFIAGIWVFQTQKDTEQKALEATLLSVAKLKVREISTWRGARLADAAIMMGRKALVEDVQRYFRRPTEQAAADILRRLQDMKRRYHYADIWVVDPNRQVRLSLGPQPEVLGRAYEEAFAAALATHEPAWTDFHTDQGQPLLHLSVVAPLFAADSRRHSIGAIVLICDPAQFLYPLIQAWPTPSRTAETLLVRRDGDEVLFLNELRHQTGTALKLRIPLGQSDLPAALAIRGQQGIVEGRDYRGKRVIAAILPVPDSPWFMVAKMDAREAFAEWNFRSAMILAMVAGTMIFVGVVVLVVRQRRLKVHYRSLYHSETAFNQALKRHRITLQAIGDAVISTDAEGVVEFMNPVAESLTGWPQEEGCGKPLRDVFRIIHEETHLPLEDPVARVLRAGKVLGLADHTLLIARNGREIPIADSGSPIRDETGRIIGVVLVFKDQTDERAYLDRILEREEKYRLLADNTLDVIWTMDPNLVFTYVNPAVEALTGYTPEEWCGSRLSDHCDETRFPEMTEIIQTEIEKGVDHHGVVFETEMRRKDGSPILVEIHGRVSFDAQGNFAGLQGVTRDITRRKRTEQALAESEARLRTLVDTIPDLVWVKDPNGVYLNCNPTYERFMGAQQSDIVGKTDYDFLDRERADFFREHDRNAMETGRPRLTEELLTFAGDGYQGQFETIRTPMRDTNDDIAGVLGIARDISERKNAEKKRLELEDQLHQSQRLESVGRLAGGVAHDFNNILSVIIGYAELAVEDLRPGDPLHDDLTEIVHAAQRSRDITRQLLAFARKETIAPRVLDLNQTVANLFKMLRRLIGEDIDLAWRPAPELWPVRMDPSQVDQILANLCVNARDAIQDVGKVTIETDAVTIDAAYCADHPEFKPGDFVVLAVSDDGVGMDREILDSIFEPFFTTKSVGRGTGLGLATVYGIVRQNEGFINVYSEPGEGTSFRIYLPRYASGDEPSRSPHVEGIVTGRGETVLVVEDDPAILKLTVRILEPLNYTVLKAHSPGEAIETAHACGEAIHLLVTDVVMPDMNGRELSETLARTRPNLKTLFMSGYTADVIAHRGVLDSDVHFIHKPFSKKELAAKVREALDGDG